MASLNEPGPSAFRFVTRMIFPPRPPTVAAAQPTASGNAAPDASVSLVFATAQTKPRKTNKDTMRMAIS
jgi:hypothetical protein